MVASSILKKCKSGNQQAYRQLYEATVPYVFTIVKRYVYEESEWKDQVQEVFAQVFQSLPNYDPVKGAFKSFLRGITVNTCLMYLRNKKKMPLLNSLDQVAENPVFDIDPNQLERLTKKDIENILQQMPEGYKTIFMLHAIDEFSHEEIAKMLNISPETVRSQFFRAKKWILNKSIIDTKSSSYGLF